MAKVLFEVVLLLLAAPQFSSQEEIVIPVPVADEDLIPSPESKLAPTKATNMSDVRTVMTSKVVNGMTLTLTSNFILVYMDLPTTVIFNYSLDCSNAHNDYGVLFSLSNYYVATISSPQPVFIGDVKSSCRQEGEASGEVSVTLTGILLGRVDLEIDVYPGMTPSLYNSSRVNTVEDTDDEKSIQYSKHSPSLTHMYDGYNLSRWVVTGSNTSSPAKILIVCMKKPTTLDSVLQSTMMVYLLLLMTAMGCKTKLEVLKKVWRRPVAPCIGLFCQFIMMPMIAYVLTLVIPFSSPGMALGFFACGCAPGGGGSNLWSYLLGGDVSLSAAMTTISNIAAIGVFPMWIFTLGRVVLSDQSDLKIPYLNMIISLLMVAIPLAFGTLLNHKKHEFTKKMLRFLIPIVVVLTIVFIALAMYVNFYMFRLIEPILILAGALLPYIGYVLAGALSVVLRQSRKFCITIAIETGIQNTGIAFILVMFSFPPPDNVIASTPAIASSSMTGIPLMLIAAVYHSYLRCCKKKSEDDSNDEKSDNKEDGSKKENGTSFEKEAMLEEKVSSL